MNTTNYHSVDVSVVNAEKYNSFSFGLREDSEDNLFKLVR